MSKSNTDEFVGFGDETELEKTGGLLDNESWEAVSEDEGEPIDWSRTEEFVGFYRGMKTVQQLNPETMDQEDITLYLFADLAGQNRSCWANYRLTEALAGGAIEPGDRIKIVHHGKQDIGQGRTLNRMSIYKAKTTVKKTGKTPA